MKPDTKERFKEILLTWREELIGQASGAMSSLSNMEENSSDPTDQATFEEGRSYLIRFRDRESRLIRKINETLGRIEDGSYGICDLCGEEIGVGRLEARPVATLCIACKTKTEASEKYLNV